MARRMATGCSSHGREEPSTSVKRNVIVPVGRGRAVHALAPNDSAHSSKGTIAALTPRSTWALRALANGSGPVRGGGHAQISARFRVKPGMTSSPERTPLSATRMTGRFGA